MKQLNVQDTGFIYQESEETPMLLGGLGIYDQSTSSRKRMNEEEIFAYIEDRIHLSTILKQKLMTPKGDFIRPYWVDDKDFDIANHVHQLQLSKPGDMQQLFDFISLKMACLLDMEKPLWQVYIIEGLNGVKGLGKNSFAILTIVHHSCFDGVAASSVLPVLNDFSPDAKAPEKLTETPPEGERRRQPRQFEILARDYGKNMVSTIKHTRAISQRLPSLAKTAFELYRGQLDSGAKFEVPATRFNKTPSNKRNVAFSQYPMRKFKEIKNHFRGTTINDIAMCVISGALHRYLSHHGELTELSLGAMTPKNLRPAKHKGELRGNQVGGLFTSLHSNVEDPKQRLYDIHDSMLKAKKFSEEHDTGALFPAMMGGFLSPRSSKALGEFSRRFDLMSQLPPALFNTLITNVPGPNFPIYHAGAKMVSFAGMLPLTAGISLGHAVYSYLDMISICVVSCSDVMPDINFYLECCDETFEELYNLSQS